MERDADKLRPVSKSTEQPALIRVDRQPFQKVGKDLPHGPLCADHERRCVLDDFFENFGKTRGDGVVVRPGFRVVEIDPETTDVPVRRIEQVDT